MHGYKRKHYRRAHRNFYHKGHRHHHRRHRHFGFKPFAFLWPLFIFGFFIPGAFPGFFGIFIVMGVLSMVGGVMGQIFDEGKTYRRPQPERVSPPAQPTPAQRTKKKATKPKPKAKVSQSVPMSQPQRLNVSVPSFCDACGAPVSKSSLRWQNGHVHCEYCDTNLTNTPNRKR